MTLRSLINTDGKPFDDSELDTMEALLDALTNEERESFRNENAKEIAEDKSKSTLIVSGPGTGKSFIFLKRIENWLKNNPTDKVMVVSFVRKLVADLQEDVSSDKSLSDEQKGRINVSTLHKLARSIVEKNHGTKERAFSEHVRVIVEPWESEVWSDVKELCKVEEGYSWEEMREKLYNSELPTKEKWPELINTFFSLLAYYNAICFPDMVMLATTALEENPELIEENFFILDEYQDFNQAEENLVAKITKNASGVLMVGDDDQVLYEKLKSGKAELIRRHYKSTTKTNAMLPYCGRCSFHITKASSAFIRANAEDECISKIYLPLKVAEEEGKVNCVACFQPSGAVDYIKKFIEDNQSLIEERQKQLETGDKKDAFLLILSPDKKLAFYGNEQKEVLDVIASYQSSQKMKYGDDYYKVLTYYAFGNNDGNNYAFRKLLSYENTSREDIISLVKVGLENKINFIEIKKDIVHLISERAINVRNILDDEKLMAREKAQAIADLISISDVQRLMSDIEQSIIEGSFRLEHEDEEAAELEEIGPSKVSAVELMSIVGSKGLSADHVIIVGFDNINMGYITRNAFYVAMTRARKSLHIITALQARGSSGPNDFFQQLPDSHLNFMTHKKTGRTTTIMRSRNDFLSYFRRILYGRNNRR